MNAGAAGREGWVEEASLIGIDVGTTAVKAVLIGLDGRRRAEFEQAHPTSRPAPGAAEQDPHHWMAGVLTALESFSNAHDLAGVQPQPDVR